MAKSNSINDMIVDFAARLTAEVEQQTMARARAALGGALGAPKPKRRVNPAHRLQGRYMAALRPLKGKDREKVRALRASKGVEAALSMMERLAARA